MYCRSFLRLGRVSVDWGNWGIVAQAIFSVIIMFAFVAVEDVPIQHGMSRELSLCGGHTKNNICGKGHVTVG